MEVTITRCPAEHLAAFIDLVDEEFVRARGRKGSLADRYPNVFGAQSPARTLVAVHGETVCAGATYRPFSLVSDSRSLKGAMVGFVCTASEFRGQGLGSEIMRAIAQEIRREGFDFGVLWATKHDFYARLGWQLSDNAVFGQAVSITNQAQVSLEPVLCSTALYPDLETVRSQWGHDQIIRTAADYQVVPVPAQRVLCLHATSGNEWAYALVGEAGTTGYLYELLGAPDLFPLLWTSVRSRFEDLYVNDHPASVSAQWLTENHLVNWKPQRLTMWLPIAPGMNDVQWNGCYVPYFDRL